MPTNTKAHPRVVSLIASATEVVWALGRGCALVGRSHECDFPPEVARLPALTAPKFKVEGTSAEIDARVRAIVRDAASEEHRFSQFILGVVNSAPFQMRRAAL